MRLTLLILILSFTCKAQDYKRDVLYHNLAGHAIAMGSGWCMYKATDKIGLSLLTGLGVGIAAGIAKEEIWDRKWKRGTPSLDDKLSTGWGAIVGTLCVGVCMSINRTKVDERWEQLNKFNFKVDTNETRHQRFN